MRLTIFKYELKVYMVQFWLLWLFLSLAACESLTLSQRITAEQKREAYEKVLIHAYKVQEVSRFCERMSSLTRAESREIKQAWERKNWGYVAVADQALSAQVERDTSRYGVLAALYQPTELYLKAHKSIEKELVPMKLDYSARGGRCLRLLKDLIAREAPYVDNPDYGSVIRKLAGIFVRPQEPKPVLLDYKKDYNPSFSLVGNSVFKAEAIITQQCPEASMLTLQDAGHNNILLGRCADGRLLAVRCNMASCH